MLAHIQRTIEELKTKVSKNVSVINRNQESIKHMVRHSDEYAGQYEDYIKQNKDLLTQNNDLINVQLTLINFVEKYRETAILNEAHPVIDIYSITDRQEVFSLTIKDIIPFNIKHPYYSDAEFIDKLLVFYGEKEDYETCQQLISHKESI